MTQIKNYVFVAFTLLYYCVFSQQAIDKNPEQSKNNINYCIGQSQIAIENYNYSKAHYNLDKALEFAQKLNNTKSEGIIYSLKARLQLITGEEDNAIKSINKAIQIQKTKRDSENLANSHKIFGDIHFSKKNYTSALNSYNAAKSKYREKGLESELTETLIAESKTYILLGNYEKSKLLIEQSLAKSKTLGSLQLQSDALITKGHIYSKLNNYKEAALYTTEGLEIAEHNNYINILKEGYLTASRINKTIGNTNKSIENYRLSNQYLELHIRLSDSLRDLKSLHSVKDQQTQYLLNEMNAKNKEVVKQLETFEDDEKLNTITSILSVALITILSLLTLSLYKNNNIRLKTNNMLHKKNGELTIAKEKAELASKTKANFLSTVTHELRTPLYAVTSLSNMLLEEDPKPEQIQHLKSLKFSGDYLLTFINNILQINKIEANKVEIEHEPFNLRRKIKNIILALNNSASDNNVKLHFEYDKDLTDNFIADQLKISQILINLIGNSIKFTKDGDIWVRACKIKQKGDIYTLRFEVEDNGIGITQEKQDNMFESFSQGSIQINRKYGGTGLGLSIVKGLIDILNGQIYVKSKLNKGTTFYFEIPLKYSSVEEAKENKATYFENKIKDKNIDLTNVNILVVEDNKINQMITKKILTKMNLKCRIIDNGEDAVEIIKNDAYNIILMDIHMPGISGMEATKQIRAFNKEVTIFALTAVTIEDKMSEFDRAGFTDIIPKPFKQEDFEKKLYDALTIKADKLA